MEPTTIASDKKGGKSLCKCCSQCLGCRGGEFQQIVDLKESGIVIYRHYPNTEFIKAEDKQLETPQTAREVFIIHNTKDVDITTADFMPEYDKNKVCCQMCHEKTKKYLSAVPFVKQKEVKGICDFCSIKNQRGTHATCARCQAIMKKFLQRKDEKVLSEDEENERHVARLLRKIHNSLRFMHDESERKKDTRLKKSDHSKSDFHLDTIYESSREALLEPGFIARGARSRSVPREGQAKDTLKEIKLSYERSPTILKGRDEMSDLMFGDQGKYKFSPMPWKQTGVHTTSPVGDKEQKKTLEIIKPSPMPVKVIKEYDKRMLAQQSSEEIMSMTAIKEELPKVFKYFFPSKPKEKELVKPVSSTQLFEDVKKKIDLKAELERKKQEDQEQELLRRKMASVQDQQQKQELDDEMRRLEQEKMKKMLESEQDPKKKQDLEKQLQRKEEEAMIKKLEREKDPHKKEELKKQLQEDQRRIKDEESLKKQIAGEKNPQKKQELQKNLDKMESETAKKSSEKQTKRADTKDLKSKQLGIAGKEEKAPKKEKDGVSKPAKPPKEEVSKPAKPTKEEVTKPAKPTKEEVTKPTKPPKEEVSKPAKPPKEEVSKPAKPPKEEVSKPTKPPKEEVSKPAKPPQAPKEEVPKPAKPPQASKEEVPKPAKPTGDMKTDVAGRGEKPSQRDAVSKLGADLAQKVDKEAGVKPPAKDEKPAAKEDKVPAKDAKPAGKETTGKTTEKEADAKKAAAKDGKPGADAEVKQKPETDKNKPGKAEIDLTNKLLSQMEKNQQANLKLQQKEQEALDKARAKADQQTKGAAVKPGKLLGPPEKTELKTSEPPKKPESPPKKPEKEKEIPIKSIKVKKPSDDLILKLVQTKRQEAPPKIPPPPPTINLSDVINKRKRKKTRGSVANLSDLELDRQSMDRMKDKLTAKDSEIIYGTEIYSKRAIPTEPKKVEDMPAFFKTNFNTQLQAPPPPPSTVMADDLEVTDEKKGILRYSLSDRTFIEKGWTLLPTEKVVRKMNVYKMRPARPEFDWFEHHRNQRRMTYDTGEKLAEFDDNGRGRWYYRNGRVALDYYDTEELNAQQRFVIYSSGDLDERGRSHPITVLGTFDYLGNGVVFDHGGKIRLKYNQTEGVVLDRGIGPVSNWKWHSLNDPPVLQQVMIDTHMAHKDPEIMKLGNDDKTRPDNEEMLAIEFDNFIKEKSKKSSQKFKPFQIKMKALKINEQISLRVLDQATIYLMFRDGNISMKLNMGMVLDHEEIVDTDISEVGEVATNVERLPAPSESLAEIQKTVLHAQTVERARQERQRRRLRPPEPSSVDRLTAPASRPLRPPIRTVDSPGSSRACLGPRCTRSYSIRKLPTVNLYYDTRLV